MPLSPSGQSESTTVCTDLVILVNRRLTDFCPRSRSNRTFVVLLRPGSVSLRVSNQLGFFLLTSFSVSVTANPEWSLPSTLPLRRPTMPSSCVYPLQLLLQNLCTHPFYLRLQLKVLPLRAPPPAEAPKHPALPPGLLALARPNPAVAYPTFQRRS